MKNNGFLSHADSASLNKNLIINYIKSKGIVSQTQIWEDVNLSRASVSQIIKQLTEMDLIKVAGIGESKGGRRRLALTLNYDSKQLIIYDWMTKQLCVTNLNGVVISAEPFGFDSGTSPEQFCQILYQKTEILLKKINVDSSQIFAMGLVFPGLVDTIGGKVLYSLEMNWNDAEIFDMTQKMFRFPVYIDRTANMILLGEYSRLQDSSIRNALLILSDNTRLGSALLQDGKIIHGGNNMNGELGHIRVADSPVCNCGKKGCLEAKVIEILSHGYDTASLSLAVEYIGIAISTAVNIFDPCLILLYGDIFEKLSDRLLSRLNSYIFDNIVNSDSRNLKITYSFLGRSASITGMCENIFRKSFPIV